MLTKIIRNEGKTSEDPLHWETVIFMKSIMDEYPLLKNYVIPFDTCLICAVISENDAYMWSDGRAALTEIWPGCQIRVIKNAGHVSACFSKQNEFRNAIYVWLYTTSLVSTLCKRNNILPTWLMSWIFGFNQP